MLNRRAFLGRLGMASAIVAAPVVASEGMLADTFERHGWVVHWSGWMNLPNQVLTVGHWSAHRRLDEPMWVATSLGHVGEYLDVEVIDMGLRQGWPRLTVRSTESERESVKRRAWESLRAKLA